MRREHLDDFVQRYHDRAESDRFNAFTYDEPLAREQVNLDITWMKNPSLEDADGLLPPELIAQEIVEDF